MARSHDKELAGRKLVSVFLQRFIQVFDFRLEAGSRKPEEHDPGVGKALVEN